jgi:penicillin-binding protein 2
VSDLLVPRSDVGEFRKRYKWMALFVVVTFLVVVSRLFQLQVVNGNDYAAIAHENIIRRVTLSTTRGVIRDVQGKILASSRPSYNVEIVPGRVMPSARPVQYRNGQRVQHEPDSWPKVADILRLNPDERSRFEARIREVCATDEDKSPCWHPLLVREDVARDIIAELKQHTDESGARGACDSCLTGAEVVTNAVRFFPYKNLGAHMLGYVAEIDPDALAKYHPPGYDTMAPEERQKVNPVGYEAGDYVGATGIEHAWETYLRGQRGWEKRVVDARGHYRSGPDAERLLDDPKRQDPLPGRDLRLSVDIELEQAIEKAMRPYPTGAVVAVEVKTGRLLALYSKPDFDPNELSGGLGRERVRETFNKLYADTLRPMLDKTMSGAFQPGSTFKPFAAIAALENRTVPPEEYRRCDGFIAFGRQILHCTHVHGRVSMREAIAQSCNIYFFRLAEATKLDPIAKIANDFGLGAKTGIGINPEAAGRIPTRSWYALHFRGQFYREGLTLNTAIGEGDVTVTPLQMALAYAAIANGGTLYQPQIVRGVETSDGSVVQDFPPRIRRQVSAKPESLSRVSNALYDVVNDMKGTAFAVRDAAFDVAGKTGTAQTGHVSHESEDPKVAWFRSRDHAWFAAFTPSKAPEIAVVVLIEHGESGPRHAAPVAMQTIRDYYRLQATRAGRGPSAKTSPAKGSPAAPHRDATTSGGTAGGRP